MAHSWAAGGGQAGTGRGLRIGCAHRGVYTLRGRTRVYPAVDAGAMGVGAGMVGRQGSREGGWCRGGRGTEARHLGRHAGFAVRETWGHHRPRSSQRGWVGRSLDRKGPATKATVAGVHVREAVACCGHDQEVVMAHEADAAAAAAVLSLWVCDLAVSRQDHEPPGRCR